MSIGADEGDSTNKVQVQRRQRVAYLLLFYLFKSYSELITFNTITCAREINNSGTEVEIASKFTTTF